MTSMHPLTNPRRGYRGKFYMDWHCSKQGKRRRGCSKKGFSVSPCKTTLRPLPAVPVGPSAAGSTGQGGFLQGVTGACHLAVKSRGVRPPGLHTCSPCWLSDLRNHPAYLSLSLEMS